MSKVLNPNVVNMKNGVVTAPMTTRQMAKKPIRLRLKSGAAIELPPDTPLEAAREIGAEVAPLLAKRFSSDSSRSPYDALGKATGISADTASAKFQRARRKTGEVLMSLLGLDPAFMDEMEKRGISLGMLPFGPPSAPGKKLLETAMPNADPIGGTQLARIVDPEKHVYRRGLGFNSLLVDENGHLIDLGEVLHADALKAIEPEIFAGKSAFTSKEKPLAQALEKNKFVRVNFAPGNIGIEAYHKLSPHQVETLTQLYERYPKSLASYDLYEGPNNIFKNGVAPADAFDELFKFYYGKR